MGWVSLHLADPLPDGFFLELSQSLEQNAPTRIPRSEDVLIPQELPVFFTILMSRIAGYPDHDRRNHLPVSDY
jgi:hypothetical protein